MIRTATVLLVGVMLAGAGMAYSIKLDANQAMKRMAKDERKIAAEQRRMEELEAEWGRLNQPERLQRLAEQYKDYLELDRVDPGQIAKIEDIPLRPPPGEAVPGVPPRSPLDPGPALAGVPKGEITGSIGKTADPKSDPKKAVPSLPKPVEQKPNDPLARYLR